MKIAHLTTVDLSLRHLLYAQLASARDAGHEVIGISAPGPDVAWLEARGIRHVALEGSTRSMDLGADVRAMRSLWRVLREERPDVLHTHNPKPGVYGRILGRLSRVPRVVNTTHGLYATPDDPVAKRAVVYSLEAVASRFSHAELVQSAEDLALMERLHLVPRRRARHLGNGVDLDRFRVPTDDERSAARAAIGVAPDAKVIGFVGRLVAEKGLPELLEAHRSLPGTTLVLGGPLDPEKADALDLASAEGVVVLGMREDIDVVYRAFDVLALPSHREGFPRAVMEASATGVPSVATDVRGCRDALAPGVNGVLVPPRDPSSLAAALRTLLDDEDRRRLLGASARAHAEAHFDERRVVAVVESAYRA